MNSERDLLADRIKYCSKKVGSAEKLSRLSGVNVRSLQSWINKTREPRALVVGLIAKASEVCPVWLLFGEGEPEIAEEPIPELHTLPIASRDLVTRIFYSLQDIRSETGVDFSEKNLEWTLEYAWDKADEITEVAQNEEQENILIKFLINEEREKIKNLHN